MLVQKKKSLRNSCLGVAAVALTLFTPVSSFAAGTGDNPVFTKDIPTVEQSIVLQQKIQLAEQHAAQSKAKSVITPFATGEMKTLSVTNFEQETNYWCGPATVKQILHYLNGTSKTQTFYANELGTTRDGTDFSLIDDVLNDFQSDVLYVYRDFKSDEFSLWKSIIMLSTDWDNPVVLDLKITPANMPNYKSNVAGHILNTSGYDLRSASNERVRVTDPFDQGGRGETIGNKWYSAEGVWNANQAHFRKAVIW